MGVSLGESPGFPWGKSKRLKWAEKRELQGEMEILKLIYILFRCHTDLTDSHRYFLRCKRGVTQNSCAPSVASGKAERTEITEMLLRCKRAACGFLQKLRSVKTENNLE